MRTTLMSCNVGDNQRRVFLRSASPRHNTLLSDRIHPPPITFNLWMDIWITVPSLVEAEEYDAGRSCHLNM